MKPSPWRTILLMGTMLTTAHLTHGTIAYAQTAASAATSQPSGTAALFTFALPAQPLDQALEGLSDTANIQILSRSPQTATVQAPAVNGKMTVQEALTQLLDQSGLSFRFTDPQTVILIAAPQAQSGPMVLGPVVIAGTPQERYDARTTITGTRLPTDLADVPRTVDIIPEQLLQDQHAREMEDVYKVAPNVVLNDGYGGTREDYIIRGFRRRDDIYRDGVRLKTNGRIDPATVDTIQILKGPVADMGQMSPGGLVNITTKKPSFTPRHHVEFNADQHGERAGSVDMTAGIGDSSQWAYRFVGSLEDSETFRDGTTVKRSYFAPSVAYYGDSGLEVIMAYEHGRDSRPLDRGTVAVNGAVVDLDPETVLHADFGNRDSRYDLGTFDLSVPLSESWTLQSKLLYSQEKTDEIHTEVRSVNPTTGALSRRVEGNVDRTLTTKFGRVQAVGAFEAVLPITLVSGLEYRTQEETWTNFTTANQTVGTLSNPLNEALVNTSSTPTSLTDRRIEQVDWGPYIQAEISITDTLTATLGGRYETSYGSTNVQNLLTNTTMVDTKHEADSHFTSSAGLVWKPVPELSLYGSYGESFQPHNYAVGDSVLYPPEESRQYEVGAKYSLLNDRLFFTTALFDIEQENVVETVNGTSQLTGGQTSRGAEFAIGGSPSKGWNIRASYGLLRSAIVSDDPATDGNRPTNVPNYTANISSSYEIQDKKSQFDGLGVSGSITRVGERYGDSTHSFSLPSYTLVDVGAWYYIPLPDQRQVRMDLGVKNLFDQQYYTASGGSARVGVGSPRTIYSGLSVDF
jgi:iron complex outermembrane receptor protein